jgi:hypothetical protein
MSAFTQTADAFLAALVASLAKLNDLAVEIEAERRSRPTLFPSKGTVMLDEQDVEYRLRCLTLAVSILGYGDPVGLARDFYDFAMGQADKSPRAKVNAALDAAGVK